MNRNAIDENKLDQVVGGFFDFIDRQNLKYTHQDNSVTKHTVLDFDKAWATVCELEGKNWDEDKIFKELIDKKYITP